MHSWICKLPEHILRPLQHTCLQLCPAAPVPSHQAWRQQSGFSLQSWPSWPQSTRAAGKHPPNRRLRSGTSLIMRPSKADMKILFNFRDLTYELWTKWFMNVELPSIIPFFNFMGLKTEYPTNFLLLTKWKYILRSLLQCSFFHNILYQKCYRTITLFKCSIIHYMMLPGYSNYIYYIIVYILFC